MCDWQKAEHEYITGGDGYRTLAKKYGVSRTVLSEYGKKHDWVQKRQDYQDDCLTKAVQKTADRVSDQLSQMQENLIEASLLLSEKILADMRVVKSLKPYEYGHYTSSITDLFKLIPETTAEADKPANLYVALLPERTDIDDVEAST